MDIIMINVDGQKLSLQNKKETIYTGSEKFVALRFVFGNEWDGLNKAVLFTPFENELYNDLNSISVLLNESNELCIDENTCYIPKDAALYPSFKVSVFGVNSNNKVLATTMALSINVEKSGYNINVIESIEPTPSQYSQLFSLINNVNLKVEQSLLNIEETNETINELNESSIKRVGLFPSEPNENETIASIQENYMRINKFKRGKFMDLFEIIFEIGDEGKLLYASELFKYKTFELDFESAPIIDESFTQACILGCFESYTDNNVLLMYGVFEEVSNKCVLIYNIGLPAEDSNGNEIEETHIFFYANSGTNMSVLGEDYYITETGWYYMPTDINGEPTQIMNISEVPDGIKKKALIKNVACFDMYYEEHNYEDDTQIFPITNEVYNNMSGAVKVLVPKGIYCYRNDYWNAIKYGG